MPTRHNESECLLFMCGLANIVWRIVAAIEQHPWVEKLLKWREKQRFKRKKKKALNALTLIDTPEEANRHFELMCVLIGIQEAKNMEIENWPTGCIAKNCNKTIFQFSSSVFLASAGLSFCDLHRPLVIECATRFPHLGLRLPPANSIKRDLRL